MLSLPEHPLLITTLTNWVRLQHPLVSFAGGNLNVLKSSIALSGQRPVPKHVKDRLSPRSRYRPSGVAEALANAIISVEQCDRIVESGPDEEAVPVHESHDAAVAAEDIRQQQWQDNTLTGSDNHVHRRVASARARLQHRTSSDAHALLETGISARRSGALSVPPPLSLRRQLRRGKSAGSVRVHTSTDTCASFRAGSAPTPRGFRGRAVVHPRTEGGYFRPVPPDNTTTSTEPTGCDNVADERSTAAEYTGALKAIASSGEAVPLSRVLPLFAESVLEPTKAALPFTPHADRPNTQVRASATAAAAASARLRNHALYSTQAQTKTA